MSAPPAARVVLRYEVPRTRPDWTLPSSAEGACVGTSEPVPESQPHDQTVDLLKALLLHWVERTGRSSQVARNLAVRWDASQPNVGFDPDLCLIEPRTPEGDELESLCTWRPGHTPPRLAVEIVSSKAKKDYAQSPDKCAAAGVEELWVFDAKLVGPRSGGGPHRIQVWRRRAQGNGEFERVYAGEGPAWSELTSAWLFAVDEGRRLRPAEDREGDRWWMTAKEAALAAEARERAAKEAALARIADLEAQLAKR
ncbi:MAG: Uma2 family endonuclease [Deltaproteobacteria bacterium]|nr:Uma2 family endonuclease [Deltaproteobacteria bacterium]